MLFEHYPDLSVCQWFIGEALNGSENRISWVSGWFEVLIVVVLPQLIINFFFGARLRIPYYPSPNIA